MQATHRFLPVLRRLELFQAMFFVTTKYWQIASFHSWQLRQTKDVSQCVALKSPTSFFFFFFVQTPDFFLLMCHGKSFLHRQLAWFPICTVAFVPHSTSWPCDTATSFLVFCPNAIQELAEHFCGPKRLSPITCRVPNLSIHLNCTVIPPEWRSLLAWKLTAKIVEVDGRGRPYLHPELFSTVPDAWGGRRWRGTRPWERRLRRTRPCTFRTHCPQREQQRLRHTCWLFWNDTRKTLLDVTSDSGISAHFSGSENKSGECMSASLRKWTHVTGLVKE